MQCHVTVERSAESVLDRRRMEVICAAIRRKRTILLALSLMNLLLYPTPWGRPALQRMCMMCNGVRLASATGELGMRLPVRSCRVVLQLKVVIDTVSAALS